MFESADQQGRSLTPEERAHAEGLLEEAQELGGLEKQLDAVGRQIGAPFGNSTANGNGNGHKAMFQTLDPGSRFIQSEGFKAILDPQNRPQSWTTGMIPVTDVGLIGMKGTLLEDAGAPGSGSGGGLVPVPQVVPGVVETLFQPLTLESLLNSQQATTNTVRYIVEGTATSAAAGVAEGGTKPESTLGLSTKDEPIKKIATTITVSDEILQDATTLQAFVNQRLSLFVRIESERQLFRGTSGGNEVQGILTSRGVPVYAGGTAAGNYAEQIFKAMNGMRGSAFVEPEWIVMHPTDYQVLRLLKDTAGQFFGGGPFQGPYGSGANIASSGQLTGANDSLWNKAVYVTAAIGGARTALIGSSASATVWNRGGVSSEQSTCELFHYQLGSHTRRAPARAQHV
ncbi:MAG: phage major capsid protein [Solirubrobacteraceae bacterium]